MAIDMSRAVKPLHKVRKSLKRWPADPSVEDVHKLRTHTRRVEAVVKALQVEEQPKVRRLLDELRPVRSAAGDVRDMDVLVANTVSLAREEESASLVKLLEHLGAMRVDGAHKLHRTVTARSKQARHKLKQCARLIEKSLDGGNGKKSATSPSEKPVATALSMAGELSRWPRLNAGNIHPFRIEVKTLRYILQLSADPDDGFVKALGDVKDRVGDWHDWGQLAAIANKVLDAEEDKAALRRIESVVISKFKRGLVAAQALRSRYLSASRHSRPHRKVHTMQLARPVVEETARLAG